MACNRLKESLKRKLILFPYMKKYPRLGSFVDGIIRATAMAALIACALVGFSKPAMADEKPVTKPNILFIMVDDLGKEWVSCYGAEDIETPNIDALAAGGLKFNNAYSMPQCMPSRVTLLTGKYPWRNGYVNHWDVPRWGVGYFDWKKKENTTFARLMKDQGYTTCAAGKWQINDFRIEPQAMAKHGFDDWAMWTGYEGQNPTSAKRYQDPYINTPDGSKTYAGEFGPDIYADRLIDFMGQAIQGLDLQRKEHHPPARPQGGSMGKEQPSRQRTCGAQGGTEEIPGCAGFAARQGCPAAL